MFATLDRSAVRQWTRYDDMQTINHRWIKEIPSHWSKKRISWLFDLLGSGTTPSTSERKFYEGGSIPWVNTGDLNDGFVIATEKCVNETAIREHSALKLYPAGTLLIALYGATIGKLGLLSTASTVNQACFAMGAPKPNVFPRYVLYWLLGNREHIVSMAYGGGQPNISGELVRSLRIMVPPLPEQRAIAAFLDRETARIEALIARKQRLIELLDEKRKAVISQVVTKGLDPRVSTKDSKVEWFGLVPEHWQVTRLGCVCKTINDINHEMPDGVDRGIPFLSAKDLLNDGSLNFTENVKFISEVDFVRLSRKILPTRNDIVYSRIGACLGKARLVETDERFLISYSCCIVRVDQAKALPSFFRYLLDTELVLTEATMRTQGIGVPDLGLKQIARFPVTLPPLEEQASIVKYLDQKLAQLRTLTHRVKDGIDRLQEYRTALISAAVTGQIDVREEVELGG